VDLISFHLSGYLLVILHPLWDLCEIPCRSCQTRLGFVSIGSVTVVQELLSYFPPKNQDTPLFQDTVKGKYYVTPVVDKRNIFMDHWWNDNDRGNSKYSE
jgi:hypothetical protein